MSHIFINQLKISSQNIIIQNNMGIVGGCLGPKRTRDQIYVKLITEMHEESHKISNSQNLDLYHAIRQKLIKKGLLKKFIDNLSYHKHKILESMNYNYKCICQAKQIQRYYAGLVIADSVLQIAYPHLPEELQEGSIAIQEKSVDSYSYNNNSHQHVAMLNKQMFGSKKYVMNFDPQRRYQALEQNRIAYDQQYLRLVLYLFQNCKKMYDRLLQSLTQFCTKHTGIISCQSHIWKIIDKLMQSISKHAQIPKSTSILNLLLTRTKDQANDHFRTQETLTNIIKVYLQQKQNDKLSLQSAQTLANSQQIIHIYFDRCLSAWYSMFLYEAVFTIYDGIEFQQPMQLYLEKLYEKIMEHSDFRGGFFRGLFNYLLGYLCVVGNNNNNNNNSNSGENKEKQKEIQQGYKKLFANSLGLSYQKIKMIYKNQLKDHVKIQCFKLLNTWIDKQYTDIDELCYYNSKSLIFVYICNAKYYSQNQNQNQNQYSSKNYNSTTNSTNSKNNNVNLYSSQNKNQSQNKNKNMLDTIMDLYFGVIMKMGSKTRRFFIQRVFDDFREEGLSKIQYQLLFKLIKQIIYRNTLDQLKSPTTPLTPSKTKSYSQYSHIGNTLSLTLTTTSPRILLPSFQPQYQPSQQPSQQPVLQSSQQPIFPSPSPSISTSSSLSMQSDFELYLIPILIKYDFILKLQILKMLGYIIQTRGTMILSQQGRYKLCQLLFSIYQNIISTSNIREGYQFVCAVLSVLRVLVNIGGWNGKRVRAWSLAQIKVGNNNSYNNNNSEKKENGEQERKTAINFQLLMTVFIEKIYEQVLAEQNQVKLPVHAHYMLVYLIEEIKLMINMNSNNTVGNGNGKTNKNGKEEQYNKQASIRRQKINKINSKIPIKQYQQSENSDVKAKQQLQLINSMKQFLIQYYVSNPSTNVQQQQRLSQQQQTSRQPISLLTMTQQLEQNFPPQQQLQQQKQVSSYPTSSSSQQKQQYKNLLTRFFIPFQSQSKSQPNDYHSLSRGSYIKNNKNSSSLNYNFNNNYNNNKMNRSVRNSESLSLRSASIQSIHRCGQCKMLQYCTKCKQLNKKWKHDQSFNQIIDIVQI